MFLLLPLVGGVLAGWLAPKRTAIALQVASPSSRRPSSPPRRQSTAQTTARRLGGTDHDRRILPRPGDRILRAPTATRCMKPGRVAVLGAIVEVGSWMLGTVLRAGSWRYNISDLYSSGAPRPWLVMAGEAAFAIGLAALALGLRRWLPPSDHRTVGCGLLVLASIAAMAGAVARNSCEDSVPGCEGNAFATAGDWVHGIGGLAEILGIAGAALILAATLPRRWAIYSASTGCAVFAGCLRLGSSSLPVGRHGRASPRTHTRGMGSRVGHPSLTRPVS